eukprot:gene2346-2814_t
MGNSPNVKPTEQKHQTYVDYEPGVYQENRKTIPIMFKWPYNGRKVSLIGSFNNWKEQIPMNLIPDEKEPMFVVILNIPAGEHTYKFIVDDLYKIDQNQPKKLDQSGNIHNVIVVTENGQQKEKEKEIKDDSKMQEDDILEFKEEDQQDDGFGQEEHVFVETKKNPPTIPPHLRYTPLNSTAPTHDHDPTIVPIPLMVTLNHTYFTSSQDLEAIGITSRFREKYSTVVLYKPNIK